MKESVPAQTLTYVLGAVAAMALVLSVLSLWMVSRTPVVAYVDSAVLLERYEGAIEARAALQSQLSAWEANLDSLRQEAAGLGERLLRDDLSRSQREATSDSLEAKQRELARYAEAVGRQAAEREQTALEPVYAELNARIADFSEAEGIDLLLGTLSGGNILYGADEPDVTEDLLTYLNGLR